MWIESGSSADRPLVRRERFVLVTNTLGLEMNTLKARIQTLVTHTGSNQQFSNGTYLYSQVLTFKTGGSYHSLVLTSVYLYMQ